MVFIIRREVTISADARYEEIRRRVVVELNRLEKLKSISVQLSMDPPELLSVKFIVELIP